MAQKNDVKHLAAARELCNRYLEEVNAGRMLPSGCDEHGPLAQRYDVCRQLEAGPPVMKVDSVPMLEAA